MTGQLDFMRSIWAIRQEALPLIVRSARGEISPEQLRSELGMPEPQAGAQSVVTGGVAVIPLRGAITPYGSILSMLFGGGGGLQSFRRSLREAVADPSVSSILLDIDSPGGVSDLVPETAAEIRAARDKKTIVAVSNTMMASAAYWLGSQASELSVTPSGDVGSVGVYALHDDYSAMWERVGIKPTYVYAGQYKVEFNPDEPLSDEARAQLQGRVDETYASFVADVAKGRGVSVATVRNDFGEGRVVGAKRAVDLGMADRVETIEQAATRLARGGGTRSRRADVHEPEDLTQDDTPAEDGEAGDGNAEQFAQMRDQLDQATRSLRRDQNE